MADINLGTGIITSGQFPLDSKSYFKTLEELMDLGVQDSKAYSYEEDLKVRCIENHTDYIWRERITDAEEGLLEEDFIYPLGVIAVDITYSERAFNFFTIVSTNEDNLTKVIEIDNLIVRVEGTETEEEKEELIAIKIAEYINELPSFEVASDENLYIKINQLNTAILVARPLISITEGSEIEMTRQDYLILNVENSFENPSVSFVWEHIVDTEESGLTEINPGSFIFIDEETPTSVGISAGEGTYTVRVTGTAADGETAFAEILITVTS